MGNRWTCLPTTARLTTHAGLVPQRLAIAAQEPKWYLRDWADVGAPFAFHVVVNADYVGADCFAVPGPPLVVPARTLLSQLV